MVSSQLFLKPFLPPKPEEIDTLQQPSTLTVREPKFAPLQTTPQSLTTQKKSTVTTVVRVSFPKRREENDPHRAKLIRYI